VTSVPPRPEGGYRSNKVTAAIATEERPPRAPSEILAAARKVHPPQPIPEPPRRRV